MPDEERVTVTVDDGVADVRLVRADKRIVAIRIGRWAEAAERWCNV